MSINLREIESLVQPFQKANSWSSGLFARLTQVFRRLSGAIAEDEIKLATNELVSTGEVIRLWLMGALAAGTDVLGTRYTVLTPKSNSNTSIYRTLQLKYWVLSCKVAPAGAEAIIDIQVSNDKGVTFKPMFGIDTAKMPTIFDSQYLGRGTFFAIDQLFDSDMLRIDVTQASGVEGVEVVLVGRWV